jgi:hypothetical protein
MGKPNLTQRNAFASPYERSAAITRIRKSASWTDFTRLKEHMTIR